MQQITEKNGTILFTGSMHSQKDLDSAALISITCISYNIDEDDEDYLDGIRSCFNCRYRRWAADGFSCLRGFPGIGMGRM